MVRKFVLAIALVLWSLPGFAQTTETERLKVTSLPTKSTETDCAFIAADGMFARGACGDVTGVSFTLPNIFNSVSACTSGDCAFTFTLATQTANLVFAGPASGSAAAPTFRSLVKLDLPTSVAHEDEANTFNGGLVTFTQSPRVEASSTARVITYATSAAANTRRWEAGTTGNAWYLYATNDDGSQANAAISVSRTTNTPTLITFTPPITATGAATFESTIDAQSTVYNSTAANGGKVAILDTSGGARIGYNASSYLDIDSSSLGAVNITAVGSSAAVTISNALTVTGDVAVNGGDITSTGALTVTPTGDVRLTPTANVVLDPTSRYILPGGPYSEIIGSPFQKFLQLNVAELNVDTLVSREVVATQGGYVVVTPSTSIATAVTPADTTMQVRHNNVASGDVIRLEARGQVEFMTIGALNSTQAATAAATNGTGDTATTAASDSFTMTVSTGLSRVLAVGVSLINTGSATTTAVTVTGADGIARHATLAVAATNGTAARHETWYLVDPPSGSVTVAVTFSASVLHLIGAVEVTGIDQRVPVRSTNTTTGTGTAVSVTLSGTSSGDMGFMGLTSAVNTACPIVSGETVQWGSGATGLRGAGYTEGASGASVTLAATCGSAAYAASGVAFTPATTGYTYAITTRDLDATGANQWLAGDAVVNLGATGDGWLELYAERSMRAATEIGPTLVVNRRSSGTYNAWATRTAIGHLNTLYGKGANVYGFAAGDPADTFVAVTDAGGFEVYTAGTTRIGQWGADGVVTIGEVATGTENIQITSSGLKFRGGTNGTVDYGVMDGGTWTLGVSGQAQVEITPTTVNLKKGASTVISLDSTTATITGATVQTAAAGARVVLNTDPSLKWYDSTPTLLGQITSSGIQIVPNAGSFTYNSKTGYDFSVTAGGTGFTGVYGSSAGSEIVVVAQNNTDATSRSIRLLAETTSYSQQIDLNTSSLNAMTASVYNKASGRWTGWQLIDTGSDAYIHFGFTASYPISSPALTIKRSTGYVGINTSSPSNLLSIGSGSSGSALTVAYHKLFVQDATAAYLSIRSGSNPELFLGSDNSTYGIVGTITNHPLGFRANNALAMTILANGNVGIGASSPATLLHVGGGTGAVALRIDGGNGTGSGSFLQLTAAGGAAFADIGAYSGIYGGAFNDALTFYTPNKDILMVPSGTGKVGIGLAAPLDKLHVTGGGIRMLSSYDLKAYDGDSGSPNLLWRITRGNNVSATTNDLAFRAYDGFSFQPANADTVLARIDGSGNLSTPGLYLTNWTAATSAARTVCTGASSNGDDSYLYYYNGACASASSRRYKTHVAPAAFDFDRILEVQPVTFAYKTAPEDSQFGAIAEEVEALGLTPLVIYQHGLADGLNYDRMALYLIPVMRQQRDEIAQLKARLDALERKTVSHGF